MSAARSTRTFVHAVTGRRFDVAEGSRAERLVVNDESWIEADGSAKTKAPAPAKGPAKAPAKKTAAKKTAAKAPAKKATPKTPETPANPETPETPQDEPTGSDSGTD